MLLSALYTAPSYAAAPSEWSTMPSTLSSKFTPMDLKDGLIPDLGLFMYDRDEVLDLSKSQKIRLAIKSKAIYKSKNPIASFKVDLYEILPNNERLFVSSQTINVDRATSKPSVFYMDLNRFETNYKNIEIDLFDTEYKWANTYSSQVSASHLDSQGQGVDDPVPPANCSNTEFGECQLDYIFSRLNFEARPQKQISTRVLKDGRGDYTVTFPVARKEFSQFLGSTLGKSGATYRAGYGSDTLVSNGTLFISANGTSLHFDEESDTLEFNFAGQNGASAVMTDDGRLGLGGITDPRGYLEIAAGKAYPPIVLNPSALLETEDFITVNGVKKNIAYGSDVDASRAIVAFTGPVTDDQLPSTMANKTISNLIVTGNFAFTGGSPGAGKFLTTDNNGLASWAAVSGGGSGGVSALEMLDHTLNGYAINGSQATVQALASSTTLINGLAMLERNAQLDRASITSLDSYVDSVVSGLAAGTVEVDMAGEITGENNGTVINGIAMYAKQLKRGHSAGTFTAGAGTVTNGDTLLGALQKIVGNTNTNTSDISTNTTNIATNTADIATIEADLANGSVILSTNGDVTGMSNALSLNGLALFAKQLKIGHSTGLFTPGAGTVTNGDTLLGAFQKIVGNVNTNTSDIATLDDAVDDLLTGANGFAMGGEITGQTDAAVINGIAMYGKELNEAASNGVFTAGTGTVTNGDTLVSALQKIVGNSNVNASNIATNTASIASHATTLSSHATSISTHTTSIASHASTLSNLINGDQAIPISGDLTGYTNAVTLNGLTLFEKQLKEGNGLALFTVGPGNQALNNGDTLIEAIEKLAGNVDRTESDIVTSAIQIAAHSSTLASHTSSISTMTRDISDLENGDTVIPMAGEIDGDSGTTSINGISLFSKQLKVGVSNGLFTPAAGTVTNGDSLLGAMQKMVGNTTAHTTTLASHATTIASLSTTVSSHTTTLATHDAEIGALQNGGTSLAFAGEITGYTNGAIINGEAMYAKELSEATGGTFTPGAGNQTVTNADTLQTALQKLAGNIDLTETNIASHATTISSHTTSIAANAQNISDLANGDDAFTEITLSQTGNADVLVTNNGGFMELNGARVVTSNQIPGIDPAEAINIATSTPVVATVDYTDVDGDGTAATAIKLTSDKIGGSTLTLNLTNPGSGLVPTSYVLNGVQTNFSTVPNSLGNAFTVPGQDYKVYVTSNKVRIVNIDPFSGLLGGASYTKKTIRATYSAFTD
jgi:hypothetical protein